MFKLNETPIESITIGGNTFKINTAFNFALKAVAILDKIQEGVISQQEAVEPLFDILVTDSHKYEKEPLEVKLYIVAAIIKNFINIGGEKEKEYDLAGNEIASREEETEQAFCFDQDATLIYSAFMQTYNIDLFREFGRLHWHSFIALMNGLPNETRFSQVIDIRTCELPTGKGSGKERERLLKLKEKYRIKKNSVESEVLNYGE